MTLLFLCAENMRVNANTVVTVCDHANAHCLAVSAEVKNTHRPLADTARVARMGKNAEQQNEEDILAIFRTSQDDIREPVRLLLAVILK